MSVVDSKVALVALQGLRQANTDMNRSAERLATGLRINQAGDDPAGIGKASILKGEIGSFNQVKRNISGALSDLNKVGDSLSTIMDYLVEMRTISLAAASEQDNTTRAAYGTQYTELVAGLNAVAANTKMGDTAVLSSSSSQTVTVQTGIALSDTKSLTFATAATATALGVASINVATAAGAGANISLMDIAMETVSGRLATVGGYQRSLEGQLDLADSNIIAKSSQYGNVMNADLALEATNLAAARIRQDSATAVLAQANSMNRNIADYLLNGAIG
jgi:flagellin